MIYLYVLVAISVTNLSDMTTIRYFSTHSECLQEKYRYESKNDPHIYDCRVITVKEK